MKLRWFLVLMGGFLALLLGMYSLNPLGTASEDARARLLGLESYFFPSVSMEPTIPVGHTILVSAWAYAFSQPKAGDIIAFRSANERTVTYAKRVIASGGSLVEIRDGSTVVDGNAIAEPYLKQVPTDAYSRTMAPVRVTAGSYFVLGDNRSNSLDSRTWGLIAGSQIVGKVVAIL